MSGQKKSKEYKYLERRISQIEKNFKFNQSINGITSLQADRLRGLRLLCHAEFEDYFESVALRMLDVAEKKWIEKKLQIIIYHHFLYGMKKLGKMKPRIQKQE